MNIDRRFVQASCLLLATLLISNNSFPSSAGWARIFWGLLGYIGLYFAFRIAKLKIQDIGLAKQAVKKGAAYGGLSVVAIFLVFLLVFLFRESAFHDQRYHQSLSAALVASFIFLPLKTVLFEEIAFRGILPALLLKMRKSQKWVTIISSILFGLWHIRTVSKFDFFTVGGVVLVTSMAGFALYELRRYSGSLVAPIMVHWFVNAMAMTLAALSW